MKSFFEITGENGDTTTTSYLFSDSDRYFFDCGEGFQKFIKGRANITLGKVKSLFITTLTWDCIGGLIGLFLTLAEYNVKIKVYGPKGLHRLLTASREFQYSLNIEIYEIDSNQVQSIKDELFVFNTLPIYKSTSSTTTSTTIQNSTIDLINEPKLIYYGKGKPTLIVQPTETSFSNPPIVCYIGAMKDFKGKFLPEKAVALGVPRGKAFKDLQDGNSVTSKDGSVVTPDQVMQPSIKGSRIAVIRCPSIEYLDSLLSHTHMFTDINVVNHIVPHSILSTEKYIAFMERISNQSSVSATTPTKHFITNTENCIRSSGCQSSDLQISKLRKFIPSLFPIIDQQRQLIPLNLNNSTVLSEGSNVFTCKDATNITLGPISNIGVYEVFPMFLLSTATGTGEDNNEESSNLENEKSMDDFINTEQGQLFKNQLDMEIQELESNPNKCCYPKIIFTGTGSAIPSKYRNVTGNFITTAVRDQNILLDAGESTFGQLYRFFGPIEIKRQIVSLKMIWISHLHADHHLGIPNLLEKRQQYAEELGINNNTLEPITIIGPDSIIQWINELSTIIKMNYIGISIGKDTPQLYNVCKQLDIRNITFVPVIHCSFAFGIVIEWNDGFKLTYSGDTRPCKFLSHCGNGSNVQIHEATFEDEKLNDAISKRHSTVGEALEVGRNMNCGFSLLTHFSQRYPNLKMGSYQDSNYGLAIDLLCIAPYQYPLVYKMIEPFSLLFENEAQKKLDRKQQIHQQTLISQPSKKFKLSKQETIGAVEDADEKDAKRLERYQNKYRNVEANLPAYKFNITNNTCTRIENTFDDLNNQPEFDDNDH